MKLFLAKLFVSKKRKALLGEFTNLLLELPKVTTVNDCLEGYKKIGDFVNLLSQDERDRHLKAACGNLIAYLTDTKEHIQKGYHKPTYNGWKVVTIFPDINNYINIGVRLKTF